MLPIIVQCAITITIFDLHMSIIGFDTFVFVINFINDERLFGHIIIRFFEAFNTSKVTLVEEVLNLMHHCKFLHLFNGSCFEHVMFKACQFDIHDIKIGFGMK